MPERYTVRITQPAQQQLREIADYIRFTLQSPNTAITMLDTLAEEILSLDQFPNRVPLTENATGILHLDGFESHGSKKQIPPKVVSVFWCRWWDSNPHGIATKGF